MADGSPIIQVHNLEKTYRTARGALTLFQDLDLEVQAGELVAIVGQSGAGKSTLLHILGALDAPTAGTVHCASTNVTALSQREAAAFRNREIGYVWQFHYLLPEFSALENVRCRCWRAEPQNGKHLHSQRTGSGRSIWKIAAIIGPANFQAASSSGLRWPGRWSAIRGCCLADEPTGDLDETTAGRVFELFERLHVTHGLTSILVTHNLDLAARCTRTLRLEGGRLHVLGKAPEAGFQTGNA